MVYAALIAQTVVILALVWALVTRERENGQAVLNVIASGEAERAELLERIQRPEIPPHLRLPVVPRVVDDEQRESDLAEYRKVGTAQPLAESA